MSIDERIREGLRATNDVLPGPDVELALTAVTADPRGTRPRLVVALTAAAAVVAVVVGTLAITRGNDSTAPPLGPSPSPSPSRVTDPSGQVRNGRVVGAEERFAPEQAPCDGCAGTEWWIGYDAKTRRALWTYYDLTDTSDGWNSLAGLAVVGPDRERVALDCEDLACAADGEPWSSGAGLGPGADEVTLKAGARKVQVIGYDGTVRRTLDLSAGLARGAHVEAVAWSPDRGRLAVQASGSDPSPVRIWVFDRHGGEPMLVHTAHRPGAIAYVSGLTWSPDGTRVGFIESFERLSPPMWVTLSIELISVGVPDAGAQGPDGATTLYAWDPGWARNLDGLDAQEGFAWSPDGTRVAVGAFDRLLELSADDGTVLARHRAIRGPLAWPASRS